MLRYIHFIYVKSYCKVNKYFENMNFMIYWGGSNILKMFLCFMVNDLSQYNAGIAFTLLNFVHLNPFYHQCDQLCNTFIYLNQYVRHDILSME
jgi:hypothetical protein